jgi:hypothetical protein
MNDQQDINIPLSVVREAFIDYLDDQGWHQFRDLLAMRFNAYTRKRDEVNQAGLRRQEAEEQRKQYESE